MADQQKTPPKSFADLIRERPELFDDFDCRPGPSGLDPEYSDSLIPEHLREEVMSVRRKRSSAHQVAD